MILPSRFEFLFPFSSWTTHPLTFPPPGQKKTREAKTAATRPWHFEGHRPNSPFPKQPLVFFFSPSPGATLSRSFSSPSTRSFLSQLQEQGTNRTKTIAASSAIFFLPRPSLLSSLSLSPTRTTRADPASPPLRPVGLPHLVDTTDLPVFCLPQQRRPSSSSSTTHGCTRSSVL